MSTLVDAGHGRLINKPGPGRPRGSQNVATASIRWGFVEAYRRLGGVDGLVKWGKAKPDLFYPLITKLLPAELAESGAGQPIHVHVYGKTPSRLVVTPTAVVDGALIQSTQADVQAEPETAP